MSRYALENWEFIVHKSVRGNDSLFADIADVLDDHSVFVSSEAARVLYRTPKHIVKGLEVMKVYLKQRNWNWRDPKMPKATAAGMLNSNT
ncbi:MAG: hypothetical protein M3219_02035 [Thermoproteota archaeon]|nr:hypothetical protein [Thermoproteota archaeon]